MASKRIYGILHNRHDSNVSIIDDPLQFFGWVETKPLSDFRRDNGLSPGSDGTPHAPSLNYQFIKYVIQYRCGKPTCQSGKIREFSMALYRCAKVESFQAVSPVNRRFGLSAVDGICKASNLIGVRFLDPHVKSPHGDLIGRGSHFGNGSGDISNHRRPQQLTRFGVE